MTATALHPGFQRLQRIKALAAKTAKRIRAKPSMVAHPDDAPDLATLDATVRLVELIERDIHHLRLVCDQLAKDAAS